MMEKKYNEESLKLAGRNFDIKDYERQDQLSSGLATTHEQATDVQTEGEILPTIDDTDDGVEIEIPRKGYE